jgi:hypothetical protein
MLTGIVIGALPGPARSAARLGTRKGGPVSGEAGWAEAAAAASRDPVPFDTSVAHIARVYDYWLGGKDNFAADREAAEQAIAANPSVQAGVRANRAFLARAVRYLATEGGIRQFLDIGTGIPTADNTHEVAQSVAPESRIVYVDNDRGLSGSMHAVRLYYPKGCTRECRRRVRACLNWQPRREKPD